MIKLMPFQEDAVTQSCNETKRLWKYGNKDCKIVFKAPTGAGKTIMMAQFLKDLVQDPLFQVDKCFIWISFGGDTSYSQSKDKLSNFYDGNSELNLLDLTNLSNGKLNNNDVFFINWSKLKASKKEGKVLRKFTEHVKKGIDGGIFDEFIINTQADKRNIILIIDESHLENDTGLSDEIINLINPKITIQVSATPKNIPTLDEIEEFKKGYIHVKHNEVVNAGLIKERVMTQTEEDILKAKPNNIDDTLLDLAISKRLELKEDYEKLGITTINPLVLIQIPNKNKKDEEIDEEKRQEIIVDYLKSKGIKDYEIAVWLSEKKENLENIVKSNSNVSFLIFKQAVATGWDCPRAQILVMYREIKNPIFHVQTVGRILRMPEAKHYPIPALNKGYLYTNYRKNEVHEKEGAIGNNQAADKISYKKDDISPIIIPSIYIQRQDYNDLKPSDIFQSHLMEQFDLYFNTKENTIFFEENIKKIEEKGLKYNTKNTDLDIIINANIENYDKFFEEVKEAQELGISISHYDVGKLYEKLLYDIIRNQENENAKFAPERSWSILKSALNNWFLKRINNNREEVYNIIVNDLLKSSSCLKKTIEQTLITYRPISEKFLNEQIKKKREITSIEVPISSDCFTNDYEVLNVKKSALIPFYNLKKYLGKENEEAFIKYLEENEKVDWWYKNGDSSRDYFSIPYYNNRKLFYPDWFIKLKDERILILDTKNGITAGEDAKIKIEALHKFLKENKLNYTAGIVIKHSDIWKININEIYNYDSNCSEFIDLDKIINKN